MPTNKTLAATGGSVVGSALGTIVNYYMNVGLPPDHVTPQAVQGAITVLITAIVTFALGWLVPPGIGETEIQTPTGMKTAA